MISFRRLLFIQFVVMAGFLFGQQGAVVPAENKSTIPVDSKVLKMLCDKEWFVTKTVDKINSYERIGTKALSGSFRFSSDGKFGFLTFSSKWRSKENYIIINVPADSVEENYDVLLMKGEWMVNSITETSLVLSKRFPSENKRERLIFFSTQKYVEKQFYIVANNFVILPSSLVYRVFDKNGKSVLRGENDSINITKLKPGTYSLSASDWSGDFIKK
ncbi:MAG: hypothetical protein HYU69_16595 [Bacteroidetes bacterium]|nr:hypothetical protein [Bacteroidota bacterium]